MRLPLHCYCFNLQHSCTVNVNVTRTLGGKLAVRRDFAPCSNSHIPPPPLPFTYQCRTFSENYGIGCMCERELPCIGHLCKQYHTIDDKSIHNLGLAVYILCCIYIIYYVVRTFDCVVIMLITNYNNNNNKN